MSGAAAPHGKSADYGEFVPCPFCKQYSHSIGEDELAEAFMVFQSMFSHRNDGIPTQFCFDEKARDAAQVLMAAARAAQGTEAQRAETVQQGSVHDGPVAKSDAP